MADLGVFVYVSFYVRKFNEDMTRDNRTSSLIPVMCWIGDSLNWIVFHAPLHFLDLD